MSDEQNCVVFDGNQSPPMPVVDAWETYWSLRNAGAAKSRLKIVAAPSEASQPKKEGN